MYFNDKRNSMIRVIWLHINGYIRPKIKSLLKELQKINSEKHINRKQSYILNKLKKFNKC